MKTKKLQNLRFNLKLILLIPVLFLILAAIHSCSASKNSSKSQTEITLSPSPPPPTQTLQSYQEEPFVVVEEMPVFPGGDSTLLKFIAMNTKYPAEAKGKGIQGKVITRFCVTATGGIDLVSVIKSVSKELDEEAIRVVKTLPSFEPGKQGGKAVPVWYMVPISFSLK